MVNLTLMMGKSTLINVDIFETAKSAEILTSYLPTNYYGKD